MVENFRKYKRIIGKDHRNVKTTLMLIIVCVFLPSVIGIMSIVSVNAPVFKYAVISNEDRYEGTVDINFLLFQSDFNEQSEIPWNGEFIARTSISLGTWESSRIRLRLVPKNVRKVESHVIKDNYDIYSNIYRRPTSNSTVVQRVKLDELDLLPGIYEVQPTYYFSNWLTTKAVTYEPLKIILSKDSLKILPIANLNLDGFEEEDYGVVYTIEDSTGPSWKTIYNGKVVNSLGEGVKATNLKLYMEINNQYQEIGTTETEEDGTFSYKYTTYQSFEGNTHVRIECSEDDFYKKLIHEELAGLESPVEDQFNFIDEDGDGTIDWPFSMNDLLRALRSQGSDDPDLIFLLHADENTGTTTYDSVFGIEGILNEDVQWSEGKINSGLEFNTVDEVDPALVKSVQHISLEVSNTKASADLDPDTIIENCVPFISRQVSGFTRDDFSNLGLDVYFEEGPKLTVERSRGFGNLDVSAYIVEFHPEKVKVQSGQFDFSEISHISIINQVDLSKTAMSFYYKYAYEPSGCFGRFFGRLFPSDDWNDYSVAGSILDETHLMFERDGTKGDIGGHYYLFSSIDNEFSVQHVDLQLSGTETMVEINEVDLTKSFVLGSYTTTTPKDNVNSGTLDLWLEDSNHIKAQRYSDYYECSIKASIIQFDGEEKVERGMFNYGRYESHLSADISPIIVSDSIVSSPIIGGGVSGDRTSGRYVKRAWQELNIFDENTITGGISGGRIRRRNEVSGHFEVIQWVVGEDIVPGYVDFGTILDTPFGSASSEFTIGLWISPYELTSVHNSNGISNCFLSKADSEGNGNIQLGITEDGRLIVYLKSVTDEVTAVYGLEESIKIGEFTFIGIRFNQGDVDILIGEDWYTTDINGNEPWEGLFYIEDAPSAPFTLGASLKGYIPFIGKMDEISVYTIVLTDYELEKIRDYDILKIEAIVSKEDGAGGWLPVESGEVIHEYINFELNKEPNMLISLDRVEYYLTDQYPDLSEPDLNDWSLITTIYDDRDYYSFVMDTIDIPDGDEWYFIARAVDIDEHATLDVFDIDNIYIPFGIDHFEDSVEFNYLSDNGKINSNSYIGVVPVNTFENHINSLDLYVVYDGNDPYLLNAEPISYYDITSNYNLINLGILSPWIYANGLDDGEYDINFITTLYLDYGDEFLLYSHNYSLDSIVLDTQGPIIDLVTDGYSFVLGAEYTNIGENILTMGIAFTDPNFDHVEVQYRYSMAGDWNVYDSFTSATSPVDIEINLLNLRDDLIYLRFVSYDSLGNSKILSDENYNFRKNFDNFVDFNVVGINESAIYSLDPEGMIDINVAVYPVDNDIDSAVVSTYYESFILNTIYTEQGEDYIYFKDQDTEDIMLNSIYYNINTGEYTNIPIEIQLFQGAELITSKDFVITVTDTVFQDTVNISDVEVDIDIFPQENNIKMIFTTGADTYKSESEIPYILNNNPPVIKIYNSYGYLVDTIILSPNSDGFSSEIYNSIDIEIVNNKFYLPFPFLTPRQNISSITGIMINSISYEFTYIIDNDEIFFTLLEDISDGIYGTSEPITMDYEFTNSVHMEDQYIASYDLQSLPQDNYTLIAEFYDISGYVDIFALPTSLFVDFEGPSIFKQFNDEDGYTVNPQGGLVSFIIKDLSDIISYDLIIDSTYSYLGDWVIEEDLYTFTFSEVNTPLNVETVLCYLTVIDNLGYSTVIDFTLNIDNVSPDIIVAENDGDIFKGMYLAHTVVQDFTPCYISLKIIHESSQIDYSDVQYAMDVQTSIKPGSPDMYSMEAHVYLDTSLLPNGYFEIYFVATDEAGLTSEELIMGATRYFDNDAPQITTLEELMVIDHISLGCEEDLIIKRDLEEIIYLNQDKTLILSGFDQEYDGFDWSPTIPLGINSVELYYTLPLDYYDLVLGSHPNDLVHLDPFTFSYKVASYDGSYDMSLIKTITKLRVNIGGLGTDYEEIEDFSVFNNGESLFLTIDSQYSSLLLPKNLLEAQMFVTAPVSEAFEFDALSQKWLLSFDFLSGLSSDEEILFWISVSDLLENEFMTDTYLGIFDDTAPTVQGVGFEWGLGTDSSGAGNLIMGTEDPEDSTLQLCVEEENIRDVYFYAKEGANDYQKLGRAYHSGIDLWSYYWDFVFPDTNLHQFQVKAVVFDEAGNYIVTSEVDVNLYDYSAIELISNLIFGDILEYDFEIENPDYDITGSVENYISVDNAWDVIHEYFVPSTEGWLPLSWEDPKIIDAGQYTITWDFDSEVDLLENIYDYSNSYLPFRVPRSASEEVWASWGIFSQGGSWQPVIISENGGQISISVYEYTPLGESAWTEYINNQVDSFADQIFKICDVNNDGINEILQVTSSNINVIYLDTDTWVWTLKTNMPSNEYIVSDIYFDDNIQETVIITIQNDDGYVFRKYRFDSGFGLVYLQEEPCPENLIPTAITILDNCILLGGAMGPETYYSQLLRYNLDLGFDEVIVEELLGIISVIERDILDLEEIIFLGVERITINKMDVIISVKYNDISESWEMSEISDFDSQRFRVLDMLYIQEENNERLMVAGNSGLYEVNIEYNLDKSAIISPVCHKKEVFLNELTFDDQGLIIDNLQEVYNINYKVGSNWEPLNPDLYKVPTAGGGIQFQFSLVDSGFLSSIAEFEISYSFLSHHSEETKSISTSLNALTGTPSTKTLSASGTFFDDRRLPLLYLNPTTDPYTFSNWKSLDFLGVRDINYRFSPVISGTGNAIGSNLLYPTATINLDSTYGSLLPIVQDNSLIYHTNGYQSGILSQDLTGKDELEYTYNDLTSQWEASPDGEVQFDGEFDGNYVDGVWMSNPALSQNFDFSEMNKESQEGIYNFYDPNEDDEAPASQMLFVKNKLKDFSIISDVRGGIVDFDTDPIGSITNRLLDDVSVEDLEYSLTSWDEYISIEMASEGIYGIELTYELPMVSRSSLDSIQVAFDGSIVASSFAEQYPVSIQLYNFTSGEFESVPLFPLYDDRYIQSELHEEFWAWNPVLETTLVEGDLFRPVWGTTNPYSPDSINLISFGDTFDNEALPGMIYEEGLWFGSDGYTTNFLTNLDPEDSREPNTYWSYDHGYDIENAHSLLIYDPDTFASSKYRLENIRLDVNDFYTSDELFTTVGSGSQFSEAKFYDDFLNDNQEFKVRLITEKEAIQDDEMAQFLIGNLKTFCHTSSNYLNYDNFERKYSSGVKFVESVEYVSNSNYYSGEISGMEDIDYDNYIIEVSGNGYFSLYFNDLDVDSDYSFYIDLFFSDLQSLADLYILNGLQGNLIFFSSYISDGDHFIISGDLKSITNNYFTIFSACNDQDYFLNIDQFMLIKQPPPPQHISDRFDFTPDGLGLYGNSGFNLRPPEDTVMFQEDLEDDWNIELAPLQESWFEEEQIIEDIAYVHDLNPGTTFNGPNFPIYNNDDIQTVEMDESNFELLVGEILDEDEGYQTTGLSNKLAFNINYDQLGFSTEFSGEISSSSAPISGILIFIEDKTIPIYSTDSSTINFIIRELFDWLRIEIYCGSKSVITLGEFSLTSIIEEYQVFLKIPEPDADSSYSILTAEILEGFFPNMGAHISSSFTGIFDPTTITWNSRPEDLGYASWTSIIQSDVGGRWPIAYDVGGYGKYIKLYVYTNGGIVFADPLIQYQYEKFANKDGMISITAGSSEIITSAGPEYAEDISLDERYLIDLSCSALKQDAAGSYDIVFFYDGIEVDNARFAIVNDAEQFDRKNIQIAVNQAFTFDQIKFEGEFSDGDLLKVFNIEILISPIVSTLVLSEHTHRHDLYRVAFEFDEIDDSEEGLEGSVKFSVTDTVFLELSADEIQYRNNMVSFYYDINYEEWRVYFNDQEQPTLPQVPNLDILKPRVETSFTSEGILLKKLESQFFKQVSNEAEFEDYIGLIEYFSVISDTGILTDPLAPENLWTHLSSDIDVIYSFNDNMLPENIISARLEPEFYEPPVNSNGSDETLDFIEDSFVFDDVEFQESRLVGFSNNLGVVDDNGMLPFLNDIIKNYREGYLNPLYHLRIFNTFKEKLMDYRTKPFQLYYQWENTFDYNIENPLTKANVIHPDIVRDMDNIIKQDPNNIQFTYLFKNPKLSIAEDKDANLMGCLITNDENIKIDDFIKKALEINAETDLTDDLIINRIRTIYNIPKEKNIAFVKFDFIQDGKMYQGLIFAISGEQFIPGSFFTKENGIYKYNINSISPLTRKYLALYYGQYQRWFDSERKLILALETLFDFESLEEFNIKFVSEKDFCPSCRRIISIFGDYKALSNLKIENNIAYTQNY